jgi:hypothetical protein
VLARCVGEVVEEEALLEPAELVFEHGHALLVDQIVEVEEFLLVEDAVLEGAGVGRQAFREEGPEAALELARVGLRGR